MSLRPTFVMAATAAAAAFGVTPQTASAKEILVHMKNQGADGMMVFEPSFIKAAPGDVIRFQPTNPAHNAETIGGILPAGATPVKGKMSQEITMSAAKAGLYGIKCMPHFSMGMVALVQVGKVTPADIAAARAVKLPPLAAKRMTAMLAMVK